jgi:hypothetical protein
MPYKIYKYDGKNIIKYDKDMALDERETKYLPFSRETFESLLRDGIIQKAEDCDDAPTDSLGGRRTRTRKTNKRKTNKRKTNKRKTNKRKTNKRKTNKRKTNK